MNNCERCGAPAEELRRGRCTACYRRWVEARPVGFGASCQVCGERRRSNLRSIELMGFWSPVCHDCAACIARLHPMPESVIALRQALRHERCRLERRAVGSQPDRGRTRGRRAGEHRASIPHAAGREVGEGAIPARPLLHFHDSVEMVDDELILELDALANELQAVAVELVEAADLTRIYDLGR